jgi:NADH-quinone oxidoreductase subunit K
VITITHYLALSLVLFTLGVVGMVIRRNFITLLMCVELIINGATINFIAYARHLGDVTGQVFAVFLITIAAAEAAIGLGIIVALVRLKQTVQLDQANVMRG